MDLLFDWEEDRDRYSFEDSDRFEDDSFCSWISEPESLCNNWRGWRKPNNGLGNAPVSGNSVQFFPSTLTAPQVAPFFPNQLKSGADVQLLSLAELTAKAVACYIPFEVVEHFYPPIPEPLQLRIAFWSFPENEDDIRLYSCLSNGSADEFVKGEFHYKTKCISDVLQIGFHLSGSVTPAHFNKGPYSVAVTFDRRHITSCTCTCNSSASWCSHVVALCLFRIHQSSSVCLRAPVSESLSRLGRDQLQKFAQYLISELPQHFLPTAQRLLDELLSSQRSDINTVCGAPDPTAGPSASEQTTWCLDESALHENIKKTLVKFCIPSPVVLSDVNYLSSNSPPAATEYQSLLRPLRGREPEGLWNLLLIIREMFKRRDSNSIPLLEILTEEILECDMILTWWYNNKMITNYHSQHQSHPSNHHNYYQSNPARLSAGGGQPGSSVTQHAASSLCDELVALWRLATLNPSMASTQQHDLAQQLRDYHVSSLEKLYCRNRGQPFYSKEEMEAFPGFKPAFEACLLDWNVLRPENMEEHSEEAAQRGSVPFWVRSLMKIRSDGEIMKVVHAKGNNKDNNNPSSCMFLSSLSSTYPLKGAEGNATGEGHLLEMEELSSSTNVVSKFADQSYFADIRKVMGMQEIKFAVAEALYAHGHLAEASELARELAEEMLASCQATELYQSKHIVSEADKRKRMSANNPAFQMLANASFLCSVLLENPLNNLIAFKIGIYALEMNRPPAPTKQLEVKLAYQESELANQLKKIPLTPEELDIIRDRAEKLKDGRIKSRGEAMLPVTLAAFIFDSLCLSGNKPGAMVQTTAADERLGFESAVIALGLKANVSEAEHPLLCEGLRRQRGELAIALLVHCKDDPAKLARVMDKILDRDVHQLYKTPPPWYAYLNESPATASSPLTSSSSSGGGSVPPLSSSSSSSSSSSGVSTSSVLSSTTLSSTAPTLPPPLLSANLISSVSSLPVEASSASQPQASISLVVSSPTLKFSDIKPLQNHKKSKPPTPSTFPLPPQSVALQVSHSSKVYTSPSSLSHSSLTTPSSVAKKLAASLSLGEPKCRGGGEAIGLLTESEEGMQATALTLPDHVLPRETSTSTQTQSMDKNHSKAEDDFTGDDDDGNKYKEWETKFRCTNLKTAKKPSIGMASVDSSAPETTSSDNSPTLSRRATKPPSGGSPHHHHHHINPCADSDSGSSHESFDFNNSDLQTGSVASRDADSPPINQMFENAYQPQQITAGHNSISGLMNAKVTRYKGKNRIMPLLPNQPSEALAHFMFELAKTILVKAGGNVSTSLFTQHSINFQNSSSSNNATGGNNSGNSNGGPNGPHRALHLCAFQIGLYALGLNNRVSPNWISRTYSSLVSWINGQATEIGSAAIKILTQAWENHLTPQEAASLADKASRCRDPSMVSAAAELALSCLSFASYLNTNEIHIALNQCKDQSSDMLQRACLSVEMAAKDGGVHSEVLFEIAKRWYELYTGPVLSTTAPSGSHGERRNTSNPPNDPAAIHMPPTTMQREEVNVGIVDSRLSVYPRAPYTLQPYGFQPQQLFYHQPQQSQQPQAIHHQQHYLAPQPTQPYLPTPPFSYLSIHPNPPNNSVVTFPGGQNPYFPQHQVIRHRGAQQIVQMNIAPHVLPIQVQPPASYQIAFVGQNNPGMAPGTWPPVFGYQQYPVDPMQPGVMVASMPPPNAMHLQQVPSLQSSLPPSTQYPPQLPTPGATTSAHSGSQAPVPSSVVYFLYAAYRVGMLAMEALARKVHDDRPQVKFSRNPPYGEDVKWLLEVSIKLGTTQVQQFCASTCTAVLSPFVLSDIAIDMAKAFSNGNFNQMNQNLRIPFIQSLLQKSSQMFVQCTHARIHHIVPQDYEEFINILYSARKVFLLIPDGQTQFNELINGLKRSKSCKKDLWQRIVGLLN